MRRVQPTIGGFPKWARCFVGCVAVAGMTLSTARTAFAWGSQGHSHITGGAILHLPQPLRNFFQINASQVRNEAADEPPGRHYIDIDVYPEFFAGTFPRDRNALIAIYGYSYVESNGMAPWTYADYVQTLTSLMAAAKTKQDWLNLIPVAGAQAHYIEDMHNPLHLTDNHNGQYTGNTGIHSRYETQMISRNLNSLTFDTVEAAHQPSVIDDVFDGIDVHYQLVDDIMAADDVALVAGSGSYNTAYYNRLWQETGEFTKVLFQEASEAVANGWYTAWINAGSPIPNLGLAGDYNGNNVIDAADYTVWRGAFAASAATLVNDSTPDAVNASDYTYWKTHFGESLGGGAGGVSGGAPVPEPVAWQLASILVAWRGSIARRKKLSDRHGDFGSCCRQTINVHTTSKSGTNTSVQNQEPALPGS